MRASERTHNFMRYLGEQIRAIAVAEYFPSPAMARNRLALDYEIPIDWHNDEYKASLVMLIEGNSVLKANFVFSKALVLSTERVNLTTSLATTLVGELKTMVAPNHIQRMERGSRTGLHHLQQRVWI